MKKRFLAYGALSTLACVVLVYQNYVPESDVSVSSYRRIQAGMTAQEIAELLDEAKNGPVLRQGLPIRVPNQGYVEHWKGNTGTITIFYDTNGIVVETEWSWDRSNLVDRVRLFWETPLIPPQKIRE